MDGVTTNFIWPSDIDRAESDELNRVCEYAEGIQSELERLQQQNDYLSSLASGQPLYGLEEKIRDLMARNKSLQAEVERLQNKVRHLEQLLAAKRKDTAAASLTLSEVMAASEIAEQERDQLNIYIDRLLEAGDNVARALTDERRGYVCEHRANWNDILEQAPDQSLAAHDAEVIERAAASVEVDDSKIPAEFDVSMCRGYRVGFTHAMCAVEEVAAQLRQQAKEVQS